MTSDRTKTNYVKKATPANYSKTAGHAKDVGGAVGDDNM
jgi:hypothetical protein